MIKENLGMFWRLRKQMICFNVQEDIILHLFEMKHFFFYFGRSKNILGITQNVNLIVEIFGLFYFVLFS